MLPGAAPQRRLGALAAALRPCATAAQTPTMLAQRVHADGLKLEPTSKELYDGVRALYYIGRAVNGRVLPIDLILSPSAV